MGEKQVQYTYMNLAHNFREVQRTTEVAHGHPVRNSSFNYKGTSGMLVMFFIDQGASLQGYLQFMKIH